MTRCFTPHDATHGPVNPALFISKGIAMNYMTHNQTAVSTDGSCLQGEITATYEELTDLFGPPTGGDGYKVDAYWQIKYEDGTVATIYNWKDGKNYCGEEGTPTEQITDWHVGGHTFKAATNVQITLDLHREKREESERDPLEKALESAIDMMGTLRKTKGEKYAQLVELAMLTRKMQDLFHASLGAAVAGGKLPDVGADVMNAINTQMMARVLSLAARLGDIPKSDKDYAEELMGWVDRIKEAESKGAEGLMKDPRVLRKIFDADKED